MLAGCDKENDDAQSPGKDMDVAIEVTSASGDSAAIIGKINQFREHAGNPLNSTPITNGGRREINWDGVPADFTSPKAFPATFFNATEKDAPDGRKRGLIYQPANTSLLVSETNFAEIDTTFKSQFKAFSKAKLFSPKGTNVSEIIFMLPGTNTPAYVTSFGVIFADVDHAESTYIDAYQDDKLLGRYKASVANKGFSFVGLHTHKYKITRIKITSGNTALAPNIQDGPQKDLVVLDDLIYSEPVALKK
ncbi:hypothetical protein GCM10023313_32120 [Mucilaginibacter defluvii]|uniref:Lipoprotein n=2 Tax=Mucilaginibacter defluvii TaxID=1196019 RepID=A0ABP9G200_9SPHI